MSKTYGTLTSPSGALDKTLRGGDWIRSVLKTWNTEVVSFLDKDDNGSIELRDATGQVIDTIRFTKGGFVGKE